MADELEQKILDNATGPARASGDSGSVEQHRPSELIEVDRYLQSKRATRRRGLGTLLKKLIPPGTD
jgi:hypothetical protein